MTDTTTGRPARELPWMADPGTAEDTVTDMTTGRPDPYDEITRRRDGLAYLLTDPDTGADTSGLSVPCSRYGRNSADCAPVAWRVAYLVARETGEPITRAGLDHAMGLVVNDHDDVAYLVRHYGHGHYV